MKITLISPYHGGSHQAWAEGLKSSSQFQIDLLTLPARFWKWRMHGSAVTLARRFMEKDMDPDGVLVTDMLDLTTFLALTRAKTYNLPAMLYMHENQLTYPLPTDKTSGPMRRQLGERDRHYAFINYASMMAADRVFFNSTYHFDVFFAALHKFLKHFPEYNELGSIKKLKKRCDILPVGIDLRRLEKNVGDSEAANLKAKEPMILWNQRWEYDKNPDGFFSALMVLANEGVNFRLAICGQQYGKIPPAFDRGIQQLSGHIIHLGFAPFHRYKQLLWEADIVVSTAFHEFFGISILEAIFTQTFPVLPARLSYPELIPPEYQGLVLYDDQAAFLERLRWAIDHPGEREVISLKLSQLASQYDWIKIGPQYDRMIAQVLG